MFIDRDPATIVDDGNTVVRVDLYDNFFAITGQGFVDRVVDYLVDKVMKAVDRS